MRLSVLDQSPVRSGGTYAEALHETIELAQITERLGYHRYWVAEHHGSDSFAGSAPELLIGQIAAATDRIRVGSGGVIDTRGFLMDIDAGETDRYDVTFTHIFPTERLGAQARWVE